MFGRFPIVLALIASAAPAQTPPTPKSVPIAPAEIDDQLEITGDAVAGKEVRTRMTVPATVNGAGPFRFIVDSGADRSVVGAQLARRLALPAGDTVTMHSMAGSTTVRTAEVGRLAVGGSVVHHISAPVLAEAHLGADGLLGIDALAGQRLMLDFERDTVTLEDARRRVAGQPGDIVVVARRRRGQLILTQARAGGTVVEAVIDTGAEITMANSALRTKLFGARRLPKAQLVQLVSVTGATITAELVVLPQIRLGGIVLEQVPVAFADVPPFRMFDLAERPAILLGTDLMAIFRRVSLDFRARKVRFQLRACGNDGLTMNSGALSRIEQRAGKRSRCR